MEYNLIVKDFGKIKEANVHVSPLTLFVGDNNSGKSYLLSLLWALQSLTSSSLLFHHIKGLKDSSLQTIKESLETLIQNTTSDRNGSLEFSNQNFIDVLNFLFEQTKTDFVRDIFNDPKVDIGHLEIQMKPMTFLINTKIDTPKTIHFSFGDSMRGFSLGYDENISSQRIAESCVASAITWLLESNLGTNVSFLPAARTGFMLSRNVINQYSRKSTFDFVVANNGEYSLTNVIEPFTKPILQFLSLLETAPYAPIGYKRERLVNWIEMELMHGSIVNIDNPSLEIRYIPTGKEESISLRASSAVVTELAPLIICLNNHSFLRTLCYEEPEMCLHPQLQAQMGKLLVRLVNSGVNVIATTHSDIIIQHVNNMCRLSNITERKDIMNKFDLIDDDLIDTSLVAIYQLKDCGDYSTVEEIKSGENGFEVPTFYDALMDILQQTTDIEDAVTEQEA